MSWLLSIITPRRLIDATLGFSFIVIVAAWCAWIFINAITGCGSSYHTADGTQVAGVCVYHPSKS